MRPPAIGSKKPWSLAAVCGGLFGLACQATEVEPGVGGPSLSPSEGMATGHETIELALGDLEISASEVSEISLQGLAVLRREVVDERTLRFFSQGGHAGGADLRITSAAGDEFLVEEAFVYADPIAPRFDRMVALGASLTHGVQSGVPTEHGALAGAVFLVARQAGAFLPQPLLQPDLFPPLQPTDIGPPPVCEVPDVAGFVAQAAVEVLGVLVDSDTGEFSFALGRQDPMVEIANFGVGGARLSDTVHGLATDDFGLNFMGHLVLDPWGDLGAPIELSPLERVEALEPTLILSTDVFGNDVINALVLSDAIELDELTPMDEAETDLRAFVERLAATDAEVFIADLPTASLLPVTREKRARLEEAGTSSDEIDAMIETVDAAGTALNALLHELAGEHPNVHVVPMAARVAELETNGLDVGDRHLTILKMGGLLSMDGIHFSDTGYGVMAQVFIDEINAVVGLEIPSVDLEEIMAGDPFGAPAIEASGIDPSACDIR